MPTPVRLDRRYVRLARRTLRLEVQELSRSRSPKRYWKIGETRLSDSRRSIPASASTSASELAKGLLDDDVAAGQQRLCAPARNEGADGVQMSTMSRSRARRSSK